MESVPLVQPNLSPTAMVKDGQRNGQTKSSAVAQLCFVHVKVCVARFLISGGMPTPVDQSLN